MSIRIAGPPRSWDGPRPDRRRLRTRASRVLRELEHPGDELSVSFVLDDRMAEINGSWRGKPRPTDVLSFSLVDGPHADFRGGLLGEVVIGIETAARQARRGRRTLEAEILRLLIHGVLHLLGHDHERADEARRMRAEERRLWRAVAP